MAASLAELPDANTAAIEAVRRNRAEGVRDEPDVHAVGIGVERVPDELRECGSRGASCETLKMVAVNLDCGFRPS